MIRAIRIVGGFVVASVVCVSALAAPKVGEKIDFNATSMDGKGVNSKALKGKMVLLEFWATTCLVCVAEAPYVARLNEEYGPKGLQIVGITLDDDANAAVKFSKEAGWTWPQVKDKPQRRLQKQFGVEGTPSLFLINPEGTLVWTGEPAGLGAAIEEQMRKTPPKLPEKTVTKPLPGAAGTPAGVGDAKAKSAMSMAAAYKTAGKYDLARQRYETVIKEFPGTPQAEEAKRELGSLPK